MPGRDEMIDALNLDFAERLYWRYLEDGESVPTRWRRFFARLAEEEREEDRGDDGTASRRPRPRRAPAFSPPSVFAARSGTGRATDAAVQAASERLVEAYRAVGHRAARLDPLGRRPPNPPELQPEYHGLGEADLARSVRFSPGSRPDEDSPTRPLRGVLRHLRRSYCGPLTVELGHLRDPEARRWLRERFEGPALRRRPDRAARRALLERLTDAVVFERFVRRKFLGTKSYSLEGAETLLPLLDAAIETAGGAGVAEVVLAMTHRGRLDVLANLVGKPVESIFRELRDDAPRALGDVQHHLGESCDRPLEGGGQVHVSLCFNPSHLESVGPVAAGRVRAKQDRVGDGRRARGMALLVHGDAAFAGEGVVQELVNLSGLEAYDTGGCVHVVLDNQIGFTTPPEEGRSFEYASDVARRLDVPVLHVNGDEPEAVVRAAELAVGFRQEFGRDVVVELRCYRRFGHSEIDEPRFTQPCLYERIGEEAGVRERYRERLAEDGDVEREEAERWARKRDDALQAVLDGMPPGGAPSGRDELEPGGVWAGYAGGPVERRDDVETGVARAALAEVLESMTRLPAGFDPLRQIERMLASRAAMARGEQPLDWATAEALALVTLAREGVPVRLTGQDSVRGTFSQRHAAVFDQETGRRHELLQQAAPGLAPLEVRNSPLSELGVLGFEYGYSLDRPEGLTLWEAQYGDFANGGQVVIDQFVASAEDKWRRLSALVLLLPHGYEGQGPEHSSARLERFLTAAAEDNLQVVQPSTPAQYFHVLRRQALQRWKKPLVVLTPKGLLRSERCTSSLDELAGGGFRRVLGDTGGGSGVRRALLATGRIVHELERRREEEGRSDLAVVRLEELYPLPRAELEEALDRYSQGTRVVWVQEEPENMGAWRFLRLCFGDRLFGRFPFDGVARPESASPASGSQAAHRAEEERLLERACGGSSA